MLDSASHGEEIPDITKMKEPLDQLEKQQPDCPDFLKAMVPSNGQIIIWEFHPTTVKTTMEIRAEDGEMQRFDQAYEFEFTFKRPVGSRANSRPRLLPLRIEEGEDDMK
jgi:hypothetical protein